MLGKRSCWVACLLLYVFGNQGLEFGAEAERVGGDTRNVIKSSGNVQILIRGSFPGLRTARESHGNLFYLRNVIETDGYKSSVPVQDVYPGCGLFSIPDSTTKRGEKIN